MMIVFRATVPQAIADYVNALHWPQTAQGTSSAAPPTSPSQITPLGALGTFAFNWPGF